MFGRCKHHWVLRSTAKDIQGVYNKVTRLLYICDHCAKPRTRTVKGHHNFRDLATLTDHDLDRLRS